MYELTSPSEVARCAFFAAAACPFLRKMLMACSTSPPPSTSASRQAVKPAPVRSRSSFTCCADTFGFPSAVAINVLSSFYEISLEQSGATNWTGRLEVCPEQIVLRGCNGSSRLAMLYFVLGRHRRSRFVRHSIDRLAFHEIAFLLLVHFVGAGVHVVDRVFARPVHRFLVGDLRLLVRLMPDDHRVRNLRGEHANRAQRIVVTRNNPVHQIRIAVRKIGRA